MITGNLNFSGIVEYQRQAGYLVHPPAVRGLLHLHRRGHCGGQPGPLRHPRGRVRTDRWLPHRIFRGQIRHVLPGGIRGRRGLLGRGRDPLSGRLAAPSLSLGLPIPGFVWFMLKLLLVIFLIMAFRWTFPRLRVDQLMDFGWKVLIPVTVLNILITGFVVLLLGKGA